MNYYLEQLTDKQKECAGLLVEAIENHDSATVLPYEAEDVHIAMDALFLERPDLFDFDFKRSDDIYQFALHEIDSEFDEDLNCTLIYLNYLRSKEEANYMLKECEEEAMAILKRIEISDEDDDALKISKLHEYMMKSLSDHFLCPKEEDRERDDHEMVGPLLHKRGVCEGIAKAFKFLCDLGGIECLVVCGQLEAGDLGQGHHAWNIVKINEDYVHIDLSCNLQLGELLGYPCYDYYCVPDSWIEVDHVIRSHTPACTTENYTYFARNHVLFADMDEFEASVKQGCFDWQSSFAFKILHPVPEQDQDILRILCERRDELQAGQTLMIMGQNPGHSSYDLTCLNCPAEGWS